MPTKTAPTSPADPTLPAPPKGSFDITVPALRRLMGPVFRCVGKEPLLPVLTYAHVVGDDRFVYAIGTDRFRAAVHRVEGGTANPKITKRTKMPNLRLSRTMFDQITAVWPSSKTATPVLRFTCADDGLSFSVERANEAGKYPHTDVATGTVLRFGVGNAGTQFPNVWSVIGGAIARADDPAATLSNTYAHVNPAYVADLTPAVASTGKNRYLLRYDWVPAPGNGDQPVRMLLARDIEGNYAGVVMVVKEERSPVEHAASWGHMLGGKP